MKYVSEYRDPDRVRKIAAEIAGVATRPWTIMEVCGGQTHSIVRFGLDELLPRMVELVHGPGCPVCVTPLELIDKALAIAARPDVIFCSFGDMLRVPGSHADLFSVKARGGDVRILYSPLDALKVARENPARQVVFFAVGFETTAPANALAVVQAQRAGLKNFSLLVSHVRVPPAIEAILSSRSRRWMTAIGCRSGTGLTSSPATNRTFPIWTAPSSRMPGSNDCRMPMARPVRPPPHGLSRGKRDFSRILRCRTRSGRNAAM